MAGAVAASVRSSVSGLPWRSNQLYDVVSVLLYFQPMGGELEVLLYHDGSTLKLPRGRVGVPEDNSTQNSLSWPQDASLSQLAQKVASVASDCGPENFSPPHLLQLTRVYDPLKARHYHHYVFAMCVDKDAWKKLDNAGEKQKLTIAKLKGSPLERREIVWMAERITSPLTGAQVREIGPNQLWGEVSQDKMTTEEELLRSPGFREHDIELIFGAFVQCSYPHATVVYEDVKQLLSDLGWQNREQDAFRAMDRQRVGELSPEDFVYGLVAMDPMTAHGKRPGEMRSRYIFRVYDQNDDNVLEAEEVQHLVSDIARLQGQDCSQDAILEKTKTAQEIFSQTSKTKVFLDEFLVAVGTLQFRGTSLLFRTNMSIVPHLVSKYNLVSNLKKNQKRSPSRGLFGQKDSKKLKNDVGDNTRKQNILNHSLEATEALHMDPPDEEMPLQSISSNSQASIPLSDGAFLSPERKKYTLAQHTVKVRRSGQITDTQLLLDMERAGEVSDTGFDVEETLVSSDLVRQASSKSALICFNKPSRHFDRYHSLDAFNTRSLPNEMVSALRYFEHTNQDKPALNWGEIDTAKLGHYIISMCTAIKAVFENEPRLLVLGSPCYILGDLHGNYRDLICFEKALWRIGPHLTPSNFLFLGDYVDRGDYGIEVVSYLFAQKLQAPSKFFLLRGNHEVRAVQKMFTFHRECLKKFGEQLGENVWEAVNKAFDCMPVAAVIDSQIFCIHGGIPKIDGNLRELEKIRCPLPDPEMESNLAWQIMWNDPVAPEDINEHVMQQFSQNQGFADNAKRGTGWVFNQTAFNNFLKKNGLTHVVRAHEVKQSGFEIQQSGHLMTVFSSSHYCGGSNEAACILLDNRRIRAIRIDTS